MVSSSKSGTGPHPQSQNCAHSRWLVKVCLVKCRNTCTCTHTGNAHTRTRSQTHRRTHISAHHPAPGISRLGSFPSTLHLHPALAYLAFLSEAASSPAHSLTSPEVTAAPTPMEASSPRLPLLPALPPGLEPLPGPLYSGHMGSPRPDPGPGWGGTWWWRPSAAKQQRYHGDSGRKTFAQPRGACGRGKEPVTGPWAEPWSEPTGRSLLSSRPFSPLPPGAPGRAEMGRGRSAGRSWLVPATSPHSVPSQLSQRTPQASPLPLLPHPHPGGTGCLYRVSCVTLEMPV